MKVVVVVGYLVAFLVAPAVLFFQIVFQLQFGWTPGWSLDAMGFRIPDALMEWRLLYSAAEVVFQAPISVVIFVAGLVAAFGGDFLDAD